MRWGATALITDEKLASLGYRAGAGGHGSACDRAEDGAPRQLFRQISVRHTFAPASSQPDNIVVLRYL